MKTLVLFWGWGAHEQTYQGIFDTAPEDWQIYPIPYKVLLQNGIGSIGEKFSEFLKDNNLDKVVLAGHSLGGALALMVCSVCPDKVKKLILIDSEGVPGRELLIQQTLKVCLYNAGVIARNPSVAGEIFQHLGFLLKHPIWNIRLARLANNIDIQDAAKYIKIPTIIIWGKDDSLVPLWQGERLHQLIAGSEMKTLEGMSHAWILNHPEKFWQLIKDKNDV